MRAPVEQLVELLEALKGRFLLALELGEKARLAPDPDDVVSFTKQRRVIEIMIVEEMAAFRQGYAELEKDPKVTRAELAFVAEKRKCLADLKPQFVQQDKDIKRTLGKRLESMRGETVQVKRHTQVIRHYINAPGSKPWLG